MPRSLSNRFSSPWIGRMLDRFSFSNLGCPAWDIERVADQASLLGYDAVELRLLDGEVIDPVRDRGRVAEAVTTIRGRGIEVCAFDTSCRFNHADPATRVDQVEDLSCWIDLAEALAVPLLRVFGGPDEPGNGIERANAWVADSLALAAPRAERAWVTIALETHDSFASTHRVADVLRRVPSPAVAALWDSHHPYRMGETVEEVVGLLGPRLAHVHVKDARRAASQSWDLVLLGEGEVPVAEQLRVLERFGYSGYVSVEWEKKWHPEIPEPEVALPQHIKQLRQWGFPST